MALRYSCTACAVAVAGTTHAHGILNQNTGAAAAPDEWCFNVRGPVAALNILYMSGAPGTTSFIIAASSAAGTADVFAWKKHSVLA